LLYNRIRDSIPNVRCPTGASTLSPFIVSNRASRPDGPTKQARGLFCLCCTACWEHWKAFQTAIDNLPPTVSCLCDSVVARVEQSGNLPCAVAILGWILYSKGSLSLDDLKKAIEISLEDEILAFGRLVEGEFGEFLVIVPHVISSQIAQVGHEKFKTYITQEAKPKYLILHNSCREVVSVVTISGRGRGTQESRRDIRLTRARGGWRHCIVSWFQVRAFVDLSAVDTASVSCRAPLRY
jgi:hypothetical protein